MSDGRDYLRDMWKQDTTNDVKGASLEEQAKHTDWEYPDTEVREQQPLDIDYMPDQRMHRIVSFVKSGFRIVGAFAGMFGYLPAAFGLFFLAEVVGIYEELV